MKTYNVHVGIVELVEAESAEEALRILEARVREAGFETYEQSRDAFESEPL